MTSKDFMPAEGTILAVSTRCATTDRAQAVQAAVLGVVPPRGSGLRVAIPVLMCGTAVR